MNQKLIREIGRSQRLDIITTLQQRGEMTVKELAAHFRMSYMGVKQHCLDLEKAGYLDTWRRPPTKTGRPEMLYRLTTRSEDLFPARSNPLTIEVLDAVQQAYGPAAPAKILFGIFAQRAAVYRNRLKPGTLSERAVAFARLRHIEGYLAEVERASPGNAGADAWAGTLRIVEAYSPVEDLLRRFPILARLEKEMFERVLDCPVRREEESVPGIYRCAF